MFLESKKKMSHNLSQPLPQSSSRDVNHTMQWPPLHPHTTPHTLHPFHVKFTQTPTKNNLHPITNHIITAQLTTLSLHHYHR
jgi:hypothetical protein